MLLPPRPLFNPAADKIDLAIFQFLPIRISRRHSASLVMRGETPIELALIRVARDDVDSSAFFDIEAKFGFPVGRIRTVAGKASIGKNRPDVAVEFDYLRKRIGISRTRNEKGISDPL